MTKPFEPPLKELTEPQGADNSPAAEPYRKGVEALDKSDTDTAITLLCAIQLDPEVRPRLLRPRPGPGDEGRNGQGPGRSGDGRSTGPDRRACRIFNRGFAYFQKGDYDKAVPTIPTPFGLHPGYAEAYRDRGYVRTLKGDLERALADLNFAARLASEGPRRLRQPRQDVLRDGRLGSGHRRLRPGHSTGARRRRQLVRSRQCPGHERRLRRRRWPTSSRP